MNRNFVTLILIIRPGYVLHHVLIDSLFMKAHNKSKPQLTNINEELATLEQVFVLFDQLAVFLPSAARGYDHGSSKLEE